MVVGEIYHRRNQKCRMKEQSNRYKELSEITDRLSDEIWDEIMSDKYDTYEDALKGTEEKRSNLGKLYREMRLIKVPDLSPLEDRFGEHLTLTDFIDCCTSGLFIDNDGSGYYATKTEVTDIPISPSDIIEKEYRKDFTHVMWFNK